MSNSKKDLFENLLKDEKIDLSYLRSRVHPLNQIPAYVKREDELGFGISGYKKRKYLSLIPCIEKQNVDEVLILATAQSNHLLSVVQILKEKQIPLKVFLASDKKNFEGNFLLSSLFLNDNQIEWLGRKSWDLLKAKADEYQKNQYLSGKRVFILEPGAFQNESILGTSSLALDIIRNEEEINKSFDHIFMDVGSGLTAIVTLLVFAYLEKTAHFHFVLLADEEEVFLSKIDKVSAVLKDLVGQNPIDALPSFTLHKSLIAPSFGSTNAQLFKTIRDFALKEGVLLDPIYNAKLFYTSEILIRTHQYNGHKLIIHSGGGLALNGFTDALVRTLKKS
ncbi:MAG: pyridoxal-phosphate dependent enzyme [Rhabdochlamydiaceae bacterium]